MEALALLCTLHADGPLTLRRLRRAGCGSLEQLEALEPQDLASLLEVTPAVARRLGKEARVLAQRLDLVFEDREEGGEQAVPPAGAAPSPSIEGVEPCAPSGGRLDSHERKILGAVLERWTTPAPGDVPAQEASHPSTIQATPGDPHSIQPSGLVAGCIDGLDEATAGRLAELGIADLDSLAERESLPLAQDLAVPFAQVRRLQFLARQAARLEASESAAIPVALPIPIPDPVQMAPAPPRPSEPSPEPSPEALDEPITEPIPDSEVVRSSGPDGLDPVDVETAGSDPTVEEPVAEGGEPRRFWEPRPFLVAAGEVADPVPLPDESRERARPAARTPRREGVTLDWKFEIPRPPRRPEPERQVERESADSAEPTRALEGEARPLHEDTGAAGPFA